MASNDKSIEEPPRKRGRPKSKSSVDLVPQRKSARVAKKIEEGKARRINYNADFWSIEYDADKAVAGMFKKITKDEIKERLLSDEDLEDDDEDYEEDEDDLFQDEDKDVYDFDQQSSIISSQHPNGKKWIVNRQNRPKSSVKTTVNNFEFTVQSSWGSNIYSYLATFLNSRADLDLYSQYLKHSIVNRILDLTISDLCKPSKCTPFEGPSATLQNFMTKINDNEAIVTLMKEIMSDKYTNSAHRISHFVFVVKQPINGLRYYPKFDKILHNIDCKISSESAFVVEIDKSEIKKSAPVIDTLVVSDNFYDYINQKLMLQDCANLQRFLVGMDENRNIFGLFVLQQWNRAGVPYDKINCYKTEMISPSGVTASEVSGNGDNINNVNNVNNVNVNNNNQNKIVNNDLMHNFEFYDAFFVRIGSKKDALHLIARVESKFLVFNVISEYIFAFKKHGLSPNTSIMLDGMHSTYSEVLGEEKSLLVISDQLYKSFIKTLNKEIQVPPAGKFKKNVLLDKESRNPISVYFDTEVTMDMIILDNSNKSNNQDILPEKRRLLLAFLNGILVGFEITYSKCITKCYQLLSDADLKEDGQFSPIQTTVMNKDGLSVTLQFCNIETHENTVVSAYLYDNVPYSKRYDQIEKLIYKVCERLYELPFQLSIFDSIFRMYQFALSITRNSTEFANPNAVSNCVFCSREFKAHSIAFDHEIRHLGLIKFKCQKHQMMFSDFKSYKSHREEFIDCDGESENEIEMETQKLLNVSSALADCPQCEKCFDYFPQADMLNQHMEVCDGVSFSTRTPLEQKNFDLPLDSSGGTNINCGVCGLSYSKVDIIYSHMANHLSCSVCKVRLSSIDEVSVHLRDHMLKNDSVSGPGRKKIFICDICNDFYGHKNNYYYHQWNEHGVVHPPIKIEDTTEPSKRRSKRVDELSYIATGMKKFNCKFCGTEVKVSGRDYVKHLDLKHGLTVEMECLCRICADIFETPEKLSDHLRTNHIQSGEFINAGIQSIFSCDKCTFFGHFRGVLAHSKTVHCDPNPCLYECPKCPERMADRRLWRLHLEKHEESQNFTCKDCDTLFKTEAALRLHLITFHGLPSEEFKCKVCDAVFNNADEINRHTILDHAELQHTHPYTCPVCMDRFVNQAELTQHQETTHVNTSVSVTATTTMTNNSSGLLAEAAAATTSSSGVFQCDVCQKQLKTERAFELHRMKHFRTRIFQCTECQATFRSKLAMRRHIRVDHLNLEPERYECQICGKIVTQISMHMLIHKSARYQCEFCGKRFTKSAYYNEHVRIHKNEKPYECHICNRRFNKKSNLNVHISFHEKHRDDFGNYLEIKPRGRGHPNYDPMKTLARKQAQKKLDVKCGPDRAGGCLHDDMEYRWALVTINSKACGTSDGGGLIEQPQHQQPTATVIQQPLTAAATVSIYHTPHPIQSLSQQQHHHVSAHQPHHVSLSMVNMSSVAGSIPTAVSIPAAVAIAHPQPGGANMQMF